MLIKKGAEFARECPIFVVWQPQLEAVAQEVNGTMVKIIMKAAAGR